MLNVYDILLNLLDGNRVYEYFEWSNKDNIEHIKKIPIVKISSGFLDDIINNQVTIDKDFLDEIYKKCEVYTNDKVSVIDYANLFTDGYKVVGVEFNKDGKILYRSFLMLDEEEEILDISDELRLTDIKYQKNKSKKEDNLYLTREEEFRRNYLLKELRFSYKNKMYEKINYLYEEIYNDSLNNSIEDKYNFLIQDIDKNYNYRHNELFKILRLTNRKKKTTLK